MSAGAYARALLAETRAPSVAAPEDPGDPGAAVDWARSGILPLTGRADGPPLLPRAPVATAARGAGMALSALTRMLCGGRRLPVAGDGHLRGLDAAGLLGERAALEGLVRSGRISPGGSCRLIPARDGWLAVALPRGEEDRRLLPAWLGVEAGQDPWDAIGQALRGAPRAPALERARLLGLPVAPVDPPDRVGAGGPGDGRARPPWIVIRNDAGTPREGLGHAPRVADLTSLWAGPLCGQLLALAGMEVTKVESSSRPDGARTGSPDLYRLLNGVKREATPDFATAAGRSALAERLSSADVVLESARPRALRQLGVIAEDWLAERPGRIWCSITGYGRAEPGSGWVALGDDAAAAAGLPFAVDPADAPLFVGDAIADPLTGIHAAVAVVAALSGGGGTLLDVSLVGCVARAMAHDCPVEGEIEKREGAFVVRVGEHVEPVRAPRARVGLQR